VSDKKAYDDLNERIIACELCPRLREHCERTAKEKRAAFADWDYWGKPVPNFGSGPRARLLVVGLAPAAHGANRTGRMFTGDRSGDFLFRAMHETGFATQPDATRRGDGLKLRDAVITAAAHCAPPGNKPTRDELDNCSTHLDDTFAVLSRLRVCLCLGKIGLDAMLRLYKRRGWIDALAPYPFGHAAEHTFNPRDDRRPPTLLCSYHPSQQNTFTGKLTADMLREVFERAKAIVTGA